jgi:hypothetical protein
MDKVKIQMLSLLLFSCMQQTVQVAHKASLFSIRQSFVLCCIMKTMRQVTISLYVTVLLIIL